ncbi:MAG: 3-oxoacyl-ACP reductase FabG [Spirochaetes bacterium]|nr:3-oxoacyl-ACP reductase FabG [Spirochaetota bacterium]
MKLALVTGGSGGIGAACCQALADAGFRVAIHYRSGKENAEKLQQTLPDSFLIQADLSTEQGIDQVVDLIKEAGDIEVLVNNAGMTADGPLLRAKYENFDQIVTVNMKSTWYLTRKIARLMIKKKHGRVINISSVVGSTGNYGQTLYGMTKAAINNFTRSAAIELADYNVLINSIAPGFIDTKMTSDLPQEAREAILSQIPLKRMGKPEDVAKMVRFLATEGDYCTGSVFHVNGGMYGGG